MKKKSNIAKFFLSLQSITMACCMLFRYMTGFVSGCNTNCSLRRLNDAGRCLCNVFCKINEINYYKYV